MLKVKRKTFENVIIRITSSDVEEFAVEFSKDVPFYYSLLKDISKGKDSPNYCVLEKVAKNTGVGEQLIIERAKCVLSYFNPDEPEEDYYKILDVPATASAGEIRARWLDLVKTYHPDRVGEQGLDITKRVNEVYEVLRDPKKRDEYDARYFPALPVVIDSSWREIGLRKAIYSVSLVIAIFTAVFYLAGSGFFTRPVKETNEFAKTTGVKKGPGVEETKPSESVVAAVDPPILRTASSEASGSGSARGLVVSAQSNTDNRRTTIGETIPAPHTKEPLPSKPRSDGKEVAKSLSRESKEVNVTREKKESPKLRRTPAEGETRYVVRPGDSLWGIARRFDVSVEDLRDRNELESSKIVAGRTLFISNGRREVEKKREVVKTVRQITGKEMAPGKEVISINESMEEESQAKEETKVAMQVALMSGRKEEVRAAENEAMASVTTEIVAEAKEFERPETGREESPEEKVVVTEQIEAPSKPPHSEAAPSGVNETQAESTKIELATAGRTITEPEAVSVRTFFPPDKTSLYSFVSEYVSAYKSGDVSLFISLFNRNARENGVEVSQVIPSYTKNFSSLEIMGYEVQVRTIEFETYRASIRGDFVVIFKDKNDRKIKSSRGTISWALSWQDDKWRIKELNYDIEDTRVEDG